MDIRQVTQEFLDVVRAHLKPCDGFNRRSKFEIPTKIGTEEGYDAYLYIREELGILQVADIILERRHHARDRRKPANLFFMGNAFEWLQDFVAPLRSEDGQTYVEFVYRSTQSDLLAVIECRTPTSKNELGELLYAEVIVEPGGAFITSGSEVVASSSFKEWLNRAYRRFSRDWIVGRF